MNPNPDLPSALRAKLTEIDRDSQNAQGFTARDWMLLALTGIILPLALIWWGAA